MPIKHARDVAARLSRISTDHHQHSLLRLSKEMVNGNSIKWLQHQSVQSDIVYCFCDSPVQQFNVLDAYWTGRMNSLSTITSSSWPSHGLVAGAQIRCIAHNRIRIWRETLVVSNEMLQAISRSLQRDRNCRIINWWRESDGFQKSPAMQCRNPKLMNPFCNRDEIDGSRHRESFLTDPYRRVVDFRRGPRMATRKLYWVQLSDTTQFREMMLVYKHR